MTAIRAERPWWLLPSKRVPPAWWLAFAVALLWAEYVTGIYTRFPLVSFIPVSLAAWYSGRWPALTLAITIPVAHVVFAMLERAGQNLLALAAAAAFRGSIVVVMALWLARLSDHERALEREVQTLKGLLPICSFCKSIRNDAGQWENMEQFISSRSATRFSHGVCPSCREIHYSEFAGARAR
jgi:hypothetical protein